MAGSEEPMQELTQGFIERERQKFEDVRGYLDANGEASARTRNFVVALIVASVLTGVGVLNSLQNSWMIERVENWRSSDSTYLVKYIGQSPRRGDVFQRWKAAYLRDLACYQEQQSMKGEANGLREASPSQFDSSVLAGCTTQPNFDSYLERAKDEYLNESDLYGKRYEAFWLSASQGLVENRFFVHVPFFGLNFDVNDLGMLAGVGLTSILLLLWFATETELENLKLSFDETQKLKCFPEFYRLAAMRQVLTIPPLPDREAGRLEIWLPKPISFLPLVVYLWLFAHDLGTSWVGKQLDTARMRIFIGSELLFLLAIAALAVQCFKLERKIDSTWTAGWCLYVGDHFRSTGNGKWLRRAAEAAKRRGAPAGYLVNSLPQESSGKYVCQKLNDTHIYKSEDGCQLSIDLQTNSVSYRASAEPTKT